MICTPVRSIISPYRRTNNALLLTLIRRSVASTLGLHRLNMALKGVLKGLNQTSIQDQISCYDRVSCLI